jgi:hypothetical protein
MPKFFMALLDVGLFLLFILWMVLYYLPLEMD